MLGTTSLDELVLIAAVAENRVIGRDGDIPWHFPEDLERFRRLTTGHPIIMGRGTWESLPVQPLPDRPHIVLSSRPLETSHDAVERVSGVPAALEAAGEHDSVAFGIGGESVYEQLLPIATRLELTHVVGTYTGDTYFPEWNTDNWQKTILETHGDFTFARYTRIE